MAGAKRTPRGRLSNWPTTDWTVTTRFGGCGVRTARPDCIHEYSFGFCRARAVSLFRRRGVNVEVLSPIAEFWRWWTATGEALFSAAIATGSYGDLPKQISAKVAAIHPDMQWEASTGESSEHALCVTAAGVAELRPLAERWFRAAPPASETWEFAAARRRDAAVLSGALEFAGMKIELGLARVGIQVDDERQLLDVSVFHPAFASLGDQGSGQLTFLLLDWLLGEDDVERWLGGIETVSADPEDSVPIDSLLEVVVAMAGRHDEPVWILAESTTTTGNRSLVTALRPLRWIDHPLFDLHTEIRLPFSPQRDDGLPTPEALELLRGYENGLLEALGERGLLVAFETFEGQRIFHVYTDSEDQNARDAIDTFAGDENAVKTHSMDPSWRQVRQFA